MAPDEALVVRETVSPLALTLTLPASIVTPDVPPSAAPRPAVMVSFVNAVALRAASSARFAEKGLLATAAA